MTTAEIDTIAAAATTAAPSASQALSAESIARYLQGAPPEMAQYEFFIGDWDCELRVAPGGGPEVALRAEWRARWVHDGRMLVDDLTVYLPTGEEVLGWLNLRTWSAETGCWEISGHRVLAPSSGAITHGHWRGGEMQLEFETGSGGQPVSNRVRFHGITADSFEWEWKFASAPGGEWTRFAALSARRAATSDASTAR